MTPGVKGAHTWTFLHAADIHVGSPNSFRFAPAWNENWQTARQQILALKPDLVLLGGDLTRDGNLHRFELESIKADLDRLRCSYHAIPGNMDTGNKHTDVSGAFEERDDVSLNLRSEHLDQFSSVFGSVCWSFVHKEVRFSGFCDMIAGSGLPEERELWDWLEACCDEPRARHHVWIMHHPLFIDNLHEPNFDIRNTEQYLNWYFGVDEPARSRIMEVFRSTSADIVISGHVHCRRFRRVEGIRFDFAPSTAFSQFASRWTDGDPTLGFLKYDVADTGISCSFVPLARVSSAAGYGPGGHPSPSQRDYSIAWEKQ